MKWTNDENAIWLDPLDAFLSINLIPNPAGKICEIGVFKGAFLMSLLENHPKLRGLAIDPYPDSEEIKYVFFNNLESRSLKNRVEHLDDYKLVNDQEFDLIHIDGEHTESAVSKDLKFTLANLAPKGLVIIDDIWHPLFPGIISATMRVVHQGYLAPFLITRNKIFLCPVSEYVSYFNSAKKCLELNKIPYSAGEPNDSFSREGIHVSQSNSINGFDQLVVENMNRYEQLLLLGLEDPVRNNKFRCILRSFTPPIFVLFYRKLKA